MSAVDKAEALEIVENIHRRELPRAEKDRLIRRYVELRAKGVSGTAFPKPQGGRPAAAASIVASELGLTKRAVNKAIARDRTREEPTQASEPEPDPFPPRRAREALRALQALDDEERA